MTHHTRAFYIKSSLKLLGGLIVLGILLLAFIVFFASDGFLRSAVGNKAASKLGRDFVIEGPITVDWGWTPHVTIEKIKLANVPESEDPQMVEIEKIDFKIKLAKLLLGRVELPEITIDQPRIVLEKFDKDNKNWVFPTLSRANTAATAALPKERGDFPVIGVFTVNDGVLIYRDKTKDLDVELALDTVQGKEGKESEDGDFTLKGEGLLQKQPFTVEAMAGSLSMLRDSSKEFPLNFSIVMGDTKLAMKGTFNDPVKMEGINSTLDISGHTLSDLFYLTGIPLPPTPPYSLSGTLVKEGDVWSYKDFKGKVGDSDMSGHLDYDVGRERSLLKATLHSDLLDMDDLGGLVGAAPSVKKGEAIAPEQKAQAAKQAASDKALPDVNLNLTRLRAIDMDVEFTAKKLNAPGAPLTDLDTHILLDQGLLMFDPLKLSMAQGDVSGKLQLDGREDIPKVMMNVDFSKLQLARFFDGTRFQDQTGGSFGGHVELEGAGRSLADVLGSSNGRIVFIMSKGKISRLLIEASDQDIAEALFLFIGEDQATNIRCAVGDFPLKKGVLKSDIFVMDTASTTLQGNATINLKTEDLAVHIDAKPKNPSPLSLQSPIEINGTLKNPSIGLETGTVLARGAGAVALGIVLTPIAAIIPMIELGVGEDSDCKDLIAEARKAQ